MSELTNQKRLTIGGRSNTISDGVELTAADCSTKLKFGREPENIAKQTPTMTTKRK